MLVSVCIPTYSRLSYLKEAVTSAKKQTYTNIEICVSQNPKDNGPDEAIRMWCESEMIKGDVRYQLNEKNLGLSGNLNALAKFAKGEYLIFLGDDDLLDETFVSALMKKIAGVAGVGFTSQCFIDKDGNFLKEETIHLNQLYKRDILTEGILPDAVLTVFNNSVPLSASIIKRALALQYPFNEALNTPEFPFFLKLALDKTVFFYIDKRLASYRLHNNSETSRGLTTQKLLQDVLTINVPDKYKQLKYNFISDKIIPSINKALADGDKATAQYFLSSSHYPKKRVIKSLQAILLLLPRKLVTFIFQLRKV